MTIDERCQRIELILSDVDGVLTDGGVLFDNHGVEAKQFHIRDGMGIKLWQKAGNHFGVITHRSSQVVKIRMAELGVSDGWAPDQNPNVNSGPDRGHSHATDKIIHSQLQ